MEDFLQEHLGDDPGTAVYRIITITLILALTWLARWMLHRLLPRLVNRVIKRTETEIDDGYAEALEAPIRFIITVAGLGLAVLEIGLADRYERVARHVIESLVIVGVFWGMLRAVNPTVGLLTQIGQRTIDPEEVSPLLAQKARPVITQAFQALVIIFGGATLLEAWNYDIAGLVAGLGIAGLAVALATQNTLENLLGYFVILADEPFVPGEYVAFDGIAGTVEHIGFRSTRIRVLDQSLVSVPNTTVMNASITNWSRLGKRRLNITIGIKYDSSPDQVLAVVQGIRDMLQGHDLVQHDSVVVQFVEFNASSLDIMVICFMKVVDWGDFQAAKQDINLKIMDIVLERGADFAFPTRTVVIEQPGVEMPDEQAAAYAPLRPEPSIGTATDSPVPTDAAN